MAIPVNKTLDEIRREMFAHIDAVQDDYARKGWLPVWLNLNRGIARGLIELWCWCLYQLYLFLGIVLRQAFPEYATGAWLKLHCKQVGVTPKTKKKAVGTVVFVRETTAGNLTIKAERIVRTKPDARGAVYRYVTTETVVILDGASEIETRVEAEEYGSSSNVTVGQICEISTVIAGIDGVTNRMDWLNSEGTDDESDESLRERYFLAWSEGSGNNKYAYEGWARSVDGVVAVKVLDQHPHGQGTVGVIVRGTAGLPTQELLLAVRDVVEAERPLNDSVTVSGPEAVPVSAQGELVIRHGDPAAIIEEAEARLRALFLDPSPIPDIDPMKIGDDFNLARGVAELMAIKGVVNFNWYSPQADVPVSDNALAVLSGLSLTCNWEES